jgi:hypothetical protein
VKRYLFLILSVCVFHQLSAANDKNAISDETSLLIEAPTIHSLVDFFGADIVRHVSAENIRTQGVPQYYIIFDYSQADQDAGVWVSDPPLTFAKMPESFYTEFTRLMQSQCVSWKYLTNKKDYQEVLNQVVTQQQIPGCTVYAGPVFFPHGLIVVGENALTIEEINAHIVDKLRADEKWLSWLQAGAIIFIIVGVITIICATVVAHQHSII